MADSSDQQATPPELQGSRVQNSKNRQEARVKATLPLRRALHFWDLSRGQCTAHVLSSITIGERPHQTGNAESYLQRRRLRHTRSGSQLTTSCSLTTCFLHPGLAKT